MPFRRRVIRNAEKRTLARQEQQKRDSLRYREILCGETEPEQAPEQPAREETETEGH